MTLPAQLLRPVLTLALAIFAFGCGAAEPTGTAISYESGPNGIQAGYVRVTPTANGLTVVNQTERPIYLFAANAESLALLDWIPCTGGPACQALAQGASRDLPWSAVALYEPNVKQYTVYWWNVTVQSNGTARADNMHNLTVTR
jgi:hypothetical protein